LQKSYFSKVKQTNFDKIVDSVLNLYSRDLVSQKLFSKQNSVIYKVADSNNHNYALKIYDNFSNEDDNTIEVLMLEAIEERGIITIPKIIKNKSSNNTTLFYDEDTKTTYRIVLSKWLEGIDFKGNESEDAFIKLGKLVAELHLATQGIVLPKNIQAKKWNKVFYFRDEIPVYHNKKYSHLVSAEFIELMDKAIPLLNKKLQEIYDKEKAQLLHGDLNPWNIKIISNNNEMGILDFEDAVLAQPVHELAILLSYYKQDGNFEYQQVKDWVLKGYTSIKSLSNFNDEILEFLMMARTVNLLNYVLTLNGDHKKFIANSLKKLKEFLELL